MHGIIHSELAKFAQAKFGQEVWQAVLRDTGLAGKSYLAVAAYADEEAIRLITGLAKATRKTVEAILEDFGQFVTPTLLSMYKAFIKPDWKTKELLLKTEDTIHSVVRVRNPGAAPPKLKFSDSGPGTLEFLYDSPRNLSALAKGMISAVGRHYNQSVEIRETRLPNGHVAMSITIR